VKEYRQEFGRDKDLVAALLFQYYQESLDALLEDIRESLSEVIRVVLVVLSPTKPFSYVFLFFSLLPSSTPFPLIILFSL